MAKDFWMVRQVFDTYAEAKRFRDAHGGVVEKGKRKSVKKVCETRYGKILYESMTVEKVYVAEDFHQVSKFAGYLTSSITPILGKMVEEGSLLRVGVGQYVRRG